MDVRRYHRNDGAFERARRCQPVIFLRAGMTVRAADQSEWRTLQRCGVNSHRYIKRLFSSHPVQDTYPSCALALSQQDLQIVQHGLRDPEYLHVRFRRLRFIAPYIYGITDRLSVCTALKENALPENVSARREVSSLIDVLRNAKISMFLIVAIWNTNT